MEPRDREPDQPEAWEFLPGGDAFVTRRVKAVGTHWKLWRPRGRNRLHRRLLSILAPKAVVEAAQAAAADSVGARSNRWGPGSHSVTPVDTSTGTPHVGL